ncbi:MAG: Holliday junction branch migration protein RuvA, partial [Prevotella nanceiensis]|nr:Holliday junction branch migration protein RuvA [Hoylesella nanceiensis]
KEEVKLYVHEALVTGGRDDSYTLYGFATKQERELYRLLITVSGVGANTARMILSSISPAELCNVIANGDERMLKSVKGIGLKTAQRSIVDLKDKILSSGIATEFKVGNDSNTTIDSAVKAEAVGALTMLGFSPAPSAKVVSEILKNEPTLPVEQVVKLALKQIK